MANLVTTTTNATGTTVTLDDGTSQTFNFPVAPVTASAPTEAQVQSAVDTTIQSEFTNAPAPTTPSDTPPSA